MADITTGSPICSGTAMRTCTVSISAPVGNDTFAITVYDGPNATGNQLGSSTLTAMVSGPNFTVTATVDANVGSISVALTPTAINAAGMQMATFTVTGKDPDGNVITGPGNFQPAVSVSSSDAAFVPSSTSVTAPNSPVTIVHKDTTCASSAMITASATGVASQSATLTLLGIIDGTFDQGLTCWKQTVVSGGSFSGYPRFGANSNDPCVPSQAGNPAGFVDAPGGADGYLSQTITVPGGTPTLSFLTWNNLDPTTVTVSVVNAQGVETVLDTYNPPPVQTSSATCTGNVPITKSYSLAQFASQTVTLRLRVTSRTGFNGTIANFDNVAVQ